MLEKIRNVLCAITLGLVTLTTPAKAAYPDKPIRMVVPFPPGGNVDITGRLVANGLSEKLGVSLVVENRGGAGGLIGGNAVAQAKPDGYTIMFGSPGPIYASSVLAGDNAPYRLKDMRPVGRVSVVPLILAVHKDSPYDNFEQFIDAARSKPGKVSVGHAGNATTNHVSILQLQRALDTQFTVVPYKGSSPSVQDLMGGQIDAVSAEATATMQFISSGQLRALAVIGEERVPKLPNVPTLEELGVKGVEVTTFTGILVPAQTPQDIADQLSNALTDVMKNPAFGERLQQLGATLSPLTGKELSKFLFRQEAKFAELVDEGLLKAQ